MTTETDTTKAQIVTPAGSLTFSGKRMAEFIAVLCLVGVILLAYVLFEHKVEARTGQAELVNAFRGMTDKLTDAQLDMVRAQREQNCLLSLPAERREKEYFSPNSFCKQISR